MGPSARELSDGAEQARAMTRLGELLSRHLGLDVDAVDRGVRNAVLERWARDSGRSVADMLAELEQRPAEVARLASGLFGRPEDLLAPPELARVVAEMAPWGAREPLRAWTVGCGDGALPYRLALELLGRLGLEPELITIFATDLDQPLLAEAGRARLPAQLAAGLPAGAGEWLVPLDGGVLQVKGRLRSRLAFAFHDILKTPPFGRIDLLLCRQTLQYLTPAARAHALERIAFSLRPGGLLAIHPSVEAPELEEAFEPVDARLGLHRRKPQPARAPSMTEGQRPARLAERAHAASAVARRVTSVVVDGRGAMQTVLARGNQTLGEVRGWDPRLLTAQIDPRLEASVERSLARARAERVVVTESGLPTSSGAERASVVVAPMGQDDLFLVEIATAPSERERHDSSRSEALEHELSRVKSDADERVGALEVELATLRAQLREVSSANAETLDQSRELESRNRELELSKSFQARRLESLEALGDELDALLDACQVAAVYIGPDARVGRVSSGVEALVGAELPLGEPLPSSALGREVVDAVHQVLEEEQPLELLRRWRDRHLLVRVFPRALERTIGMGAVLTLTDLSTVWRVAIDAEARAHQLASLFETADDPTVECDLSGVVTYANASARELLGVEGDAEARIIDALEGAGAVEPEAIIEALEAARHGLRRPRLALSIPSKEQLLDVTARPLYENGAVTRVVVTARDVTELDRSQRAVRESRALMQTVLDTLEAAIAVIDERGVIVTHNQAWARARGRGFPGVAAGQGASLLETLDREHRAAAGEGEGPSLVAGFLRGVLNGEPEPAVCRFPVHHQGETRHLETSAARLEHGGQELTVVIQNDVTSVKLAEQQKLDVQAKLLDADKAESLGVLAGGVAHDFNNLLVGILSNASFVLEQIREDGIEKDCLRDIELASERAAELCQQLLAFSGRGQFFIDEHHLDVIVRESVRLLQASIPRAVSLDVALPERSLPVVRADASQLRQVLFNLVTNAAEAVSAQGTVRVVVGMERLDAARLQDAVHGEEVRPGQHVFIRVVDDGSGMSPDVLDRIFDPFFSTKFTGRGLGLAAVKGIVHGHQGVLEVESEPGRGATLTAFFPVAVEDLAPEPEERRPAVLIIDDEAFVRTAASRALARDGFEVVEAASGEAGLDHFEAEAGRFVLVLLDVTMPGLSGEDVYTQLRARSRSVPVLFSSGLPDITERGLFNRESRTFFIQKPYKSRDLVAKVREILGELGGAARSA